jgi:periplasmic copper chaperone A
MSRPNTRDRVTHAAGAAVLTLAIVGFALAPGAFAADAMSPAPGSPAPVASGMTPPSPAEGMVVTGAWARATMDTSRPSAAYMLITNGTATDDALVGVSSPAGNAETHETTVGDSGMMGMQHVDRIPLPAGATVALKPGGYHIMIMELAAPLTEGSSIELTLSFEKAAPMTIVAEVVSAMGMPMPSMGVPAPSMVMPSMIPAASAAPGSSM